jgi:hypothetical protein
VFIYAHEGVTANQLVQDAQQRFNITLSATAKPIQVTFLVATQPRHEHPCNPHQFTDMQTLQQAMGLLFRLSSSGLLLRQHLPMKTCELHGCYSHAQTHTHSHTQVVPLAKSHLLLPARYPRFTLIGQAVGSIRLGREALGKRRPEVGRGVSGGVGWGGAGVRCLHITHPSQHPCTALHGRPAVELCGFALLQLNLHYKGYGFIPVFNPCSARMQLFIDTTGWAFTYPLARVAGCKVGTRTTLGYSQELC